MNARLIALANVPRPISEELASIVPEDHPLSPVGARIILGGVVVMLGCAALAWFGVVPWTAMLGGLPIIGGGYMLRRSVHERSLELGRERLANMPLCLVAVVQANDVLYDPEEVAYAPAVVLYATGSAARNEAFLRDVAARVAELRGHRTGNPALDKIGDLLDDESSAFSIRLPDVLTGGADVRMTVEFLDKDYIPGGYLRADTLLAGLVDRDGSLFKLLPATAYGE